MYDEDTTMYYLQTRYYDPTTGRFINADDTAYVDTNSGTPLSTNMFAYCENNPIHNVDRNGTVSIANIVGGVIGGIVGAIGGYFSSNWFADKLKLSGWKRNVFVWGLTAVITATSVVIGYFIGPYYNLFYDKDTKAIFILENGSKESEKIATGYFLK